MANFFYCELFYSRELDEKNERLYFFTILKIKDMEKKKEDDKAKKAKAKDGKDTKGKDKKDTSKK